MDPVPDLIQFQKCGSVKNRTSDLMVTKLRCSQGTVPKQIMLSLTPHILILDRSLIQNFKARRKICIVGCGTKKKNLLVSVAVTPAPVRVSSQRPLAPSVAAVTLVANVKVYTDILEFALQLRKTPENLS